MDGERGNSEQPDAPMDDADPVARKLVAEIVKPERGQRQQQASRRQRRARPTVASKVPTEPDMNRNHRPYDDQEAIAGNAMRDDCPAFGRMMLGSELTGCADE